jgi:hypothetical protein
MARRSAHPPRRTGLIALVLVAVVSLAFTTGAWATHRFDDVPPTNPFVDDIQWMDDHDIANGFSDGGFHPADAVSRQAMSAFMHRLADDVLSQAVGETRGYSGAAFHDMNATTDIDFHAQGYLQNSATTGTDCWVTDPGLPNGAQLLSIQITGVDNASSSMDLTLQAKSLSNTNSPDVIGEVFTSGMSSGMQVSSAATVAHTVDVEANAYILTVCIPGQPGNNYRFYAAHLVWTPPAA